ncbi:ADP-ribosylation factor 2 [Tritrichomonas foetus]|uniref:ADP-ribosylation factor 2 n=1 Tax=Tritrichomonas foetus TaxID=1144522 RepID=A0A1J4JUX9_9EUKA|nr:ADP-ribosylation factor 2 [Tritrichomonas foetus]|eukprot:OHT02248.1 ADP-ribosylation factor 2 [Tritrichomonas foetus]
MCDVKFYCCYLVGSIENISIIYICMGSLFSRPIPRTLILGLSGAGKTAILYWYKDKTFRQSIPTIGFNVESIIYKENEFCFWDVNGGIGIAPLWHHYYQDQKVAAIIYVFNGSNSQKEMNELEIPTFHQFLLDPKVGSWPILIYKNKSDVHNYFAQEEFFEMINCDALRKKNYHIQQCSALTGEGIFEGLDWLSDQILSQKK